VFGGWWNNFWLGRDIVSLSAVQNPREAFETFASRPKPPADAAAPAAAPAAPAAAEKPARKAPVKRKPKAAPAEAAAPAAEAPAAEAPAGTGAPTGADDEQAYATPAEEVSANK